MPVYIKCFQSPVNLIVFAETVSEILFSDMLVEESLIFPWKSVSKNPFIFYKAFIVKLVEI